MPLLTRLFRWLAVVLDSPVSLLAMLDLLFELENVPAVVCRSRGELLAASLIRAPSLKALGLEVIVGCS
jgi:hypothetical protein